jgi:hypothetical protein
MTDEPDNAAKPKKPEPRLPGTGKQGDVPNESNNLYFGRNVQ